MQPINEQATRNFRVSFVSRASLETLRAFGVFGIILLVLAAIAIQLTFRELSLQVLTERLDLGRREAGRIARAVENLALEHGSLDFSRVRKKQEALKKLIRTRIAGRRFIHHVEIRDRFGVRQLFISDEDRLRGPQLQRTGTALPVDWPRTGDQIVKAPLRDLGGEVLVTVTHQPILDDLEDLRDSLRLKVFVAAGLALGVLVVGLFYVLHLIRKNRMLEQSRQSAARASYVGLLASGLAHEIRNPLNAMSMNLQMLEEELQSQPELQQAEYEELLDSTKSEIKRLESLVNNFLSYARPARPRFEARDLNAVVEDVLRFLEADFRQSNVELRTDLQPLLPTVELDETQFKQALMNLLVNARQVLGDGGCVTVRTRAGQHGEMVLEVEDNGPGIPAEMRDRIFEVFYSSRGGGTGLGLPIARQVIERHGGSIETRGRVGQGTTFRIRLPRRHEHEPEPATPGSAGAP